MKKMLSMLVVATMIAAMLIVAGCESPSEVAIDVGYNAVETPRERVNPPSFADVPEYASVTTAIFTVSDMFSGTPEFVSMHSEFEALVVHIGEDTPVYLEDGTNVRELFEYMSYSWTLAKFLDGRILSVYYTMMLQSFPGQVYPHFVRVLESYDDLWLGYIIVEMISGNIEVNGERLSRLPRDSAPFWARGSDYFDDGTHATVATAAMVPLEPIAAALRYEVESLELPDDAWISDDGIIFVPTEFFSEVLRYNVFVWRGV